MTSFADLAGGLPNPTQWLGLASFGAAAVCCRRAERFSGALWRALAVAQLVCMAEVIVCLRIKVHDAVDAVLQRHGWYGLREDLQVPAVIGVMALSLVWIAGVALYRPRRVASDGASRTYGLAERVATVSTSGALLCFVVEAISLHRIDGLMYASIGPFLCIGWCWAACAVMTAAAALARGTVALRRR